MADLTLVPSRVTTINVEYKTKIVEFENGAEQRFALRASPLESYRLEWNLLNSTELATLTTFFKTYLGPLKTWTIDDDRVNGGALTTVRFATDKLTIEKVNAYFSNVSAEVRMC